jgi:hypothetical protein
MTKVVQLATRTRQGIMEETTPVHPVVDARRQRHRSRCTGSVISSGQSFSCHLACFRSSHVILLSCVSLWILRALCNAACCALQQEKTCQTQGQQSRWNTEPACVWCRALWSYHDYSCVNTPVIWRSRRVPIPLTLYAAKIMQCTRRTTAHSERTTPAKTDKRAMWSLAVAEQIHVRFGHHITV